MKAKKQVDRRAIIVSAVLTLLLLTGAGSVALASNWLTGSDSATKITPQNAAQSTPFVITLEPLVSDAASPAMAAAPGLAVVDQTAGDPVVAAYEAQLNQAYQALQEAYTQIETLQSTQAQVGPQAEYDDEHEHDDDRFVIGAHHSEDHGDD